jgi:hypothetical protein
MTKTFKNLIVLIHDDGSITAGGGVLRFYLSESELNDLAEDIRSAQCLLRDVRRRQAEETTPELPME